MDGKQRNREQKDTVVLKSFEDQIYTVLKGKILDLELNLGEQINIQKLCEELGVSVTPIRVALKRLSQEKLVKIVPRVGYYVVDLQPEDLLQIYELRKMFECYALETGINNISKQKLLYIKKHTENLQSKQSKHKEKREFNKERELHWLIIQSSTNKKLREMYSQIYNLVLISQTMNPKFERSRKEHLQLIDAILEGNVEKAKYRLKSHVDNAASDGVKRLRKQLREKKDGLV